MTSRYEAPDQGRRQADLAGFGELRHRFGVRLGLAATAFIDRYAAMLVPLHLTPSRVLALAFVREHPGCEQKRLADGLAITQASAMTKINRLAELGFLERRPGPDRRSKALWLTALGEQAYQDALSLDAILSDHLFAWIDPNARADVEAVLDGLLSRALDAPVSE